MSGRPQVPNLFVGGPLRGPPPPKGWNFFMTSSCAVAALAFQSCFSGGAGLGRAARGATTLLLNRQTVPLARNRSERGATAVPLTYRSTATTHWRVRRDLLRPVQRGAMARLIDLRDGSRLSVLPWSSGAASDWSLRCHGRIYGSEDESCALNPICGILGSL